MQAAGPAGEAGNALCLVLVPYSQAKQTYLDGCKIVSQQALLVFWSLAHGALDLSLLPIAAAGAYEGTAHAFALTGYLQPSSICSWQL